MGAVSIGSDFSRPGRSRLQRGLVALALALAGLLSWQGAPAAQGGGSAGRTIDFIELSGVIDPVSSRFLIRQIQEAGRQGSHAIVVRMDTPGGLDVSMREMVQKILDSKVPVVVWVAPQGARAASAGTFITLAAHIAVMAPATSLGAAHPVDLGGGRDEVMSEKATNDAASYIRGIARLRGRNEDWAEKAVRESVSVGPDDAVEMKIVDFVAGSPRTLLEQLDGRRVELEQGSVALSTAGASLRFHKMGVLERLLHAAVTPEIAYMLLLLGFYGLLFELYNPGIGLAGILGGVALILAFYSLSILPVSWAGVALVALGVAFFVGDLHVQGLGVLTVGGVVALLAGSVLLFAGAEPSLRLSPFVIAAGVGGSLVFFISVMTAAMRARSSKPLSGAEGIVGTHGLARTHISPDGQVMAKGTLWRARTLGAAIPEGARVKIRSVAGLMLIVEEDPESQETAGHSEETGGSR